jgi:hypothetical protein
MVFSTAAEAGSVEPAGVAGEPHAARLNTSNVRIKVVFFMFVLLMGIWRMDEGKAIMFPLFVLIRCPSNSENSGIS